MCKVFCYWKYQEKLFKEGKEKEEEKTLICIINYRM